MRKLGASLALLIAVAGAVGLSSCTDEPDDKDPTVDPTPNPDNPDTPTVENFTVAFNTNGGNTIATKTVKKGDKVTGVTSPTKDGYIFSGWFTDSACTQAFNIATATITADITLYAGWEEEANPLEIKTAAQFKAFLETAFDEVEEAETVVYQIMNDIDMTGVVIDHETAKVFIGTLDGNGHTISNLTLAPTKSNIGLFKDLYNATIKNINFVNIESTSTSADSNKGLNLFGYRSMGTTTIENVTIDGYTMACAEVSGGLIARAYDNLTIKDVSVTGFNGTFTKYSGGLIGQIRKSETTVMYGDYIPASGSVVMQNILFEGDVQGDLGSSGQGVGGLVGQVDNDAETALSIDGLVMKGNVSCSKNVGYVVGDFKTVNGLVVKNALFLEGTITAAQSKDDAGALSYQANVIAGQNKSASPVFEAVNYVDQKVKVVLDTDANGTVDNIKSNDVLQGTSVAVADITAPNESFVIDTTAKTIKLKDGKAIALPEPVVSSNVPYGAISNGDDLNTGAASDGNKTITYSGEINYYHKAVAGFAGNGVAIKLTAEETVSTTGALYTIGAETASFTNGETIYLQLPTDKSSITITVKWNENANEQTYTVAFDANVTTEAAPVYGGIHKESISDLTAIENGNTLTYTDGTIAWDDVNKGNFVTVSIDKPSWIADPTAVAVNGKPVEGVVAADTSIALSVNVSTGTASITVQWNNSTDAVTYTVKVDGATIADNPSGVINYSLDYSTLTAAKDKEEMTAAELGSFVATPAGSIKKRWNVDKGVTSIETDKNSGLSFTISQIATLDLSLQSTSSGNKSLFVLVNEKGEVMRADQHASLVGKASTSEYGNDQLYIITGKEVPVTYTNLPAGTYTMKYLDGSIDADDPTAAAESITRGGRFFKVSVSNQG